MTRPGHKPWSSKLGPLQKGSDRAIIQDLSNLRNSKHAIVQRPISRFSEAFNKGKPGSQEYGSDSRTKSGRLWLLCLLFVAFVLLCPTGKVTSGWISSHSVRPHQFVTVHSDSINVSERPLRVGMTLREGLSDNGRTKEVQWDKYSLIVKGQRVFLQ